jgi:hypothetical protein
MQMAIDNNNMFDNLPNELQEIIIQQKHVQETATYEDFLASFDIKVLLRKPRPIYSGFTRVIGERSFEDKVLLHYKPTNRFMIVKCEYRGEKPANELKEFIIQQIYDGLEALEDECEYATNNNQKLKWGSCVSYSTYVFNNTTAFNSTADLSLEEFCEWRCECSRFKKLLGLDAFEKFMQVREYKVL